ncbi:MAG: UDP-N-acetylglucosamine 1-carboxyvinyltransferase [Endomicrobiales bacterium]|nr:UDP-N-acetylglucosamine 1-carboxyvinyltransferase [Endomicrobiales bacterium]
MDKIIIHGARRLKGRVKVSGSKNAALPILVASLLTDEECRLENVPELADIDTTIGFLKYIGKKIARKGHSVHIAPDGHLKPTAPYELVRKMRASILVTGPLLARLGYVRVSLPGGCAIGARPIDIHLDAFDKLGAKIQIKGGYVETRSRKLVGNRIHFRYPSVGATENTMLAAVLARGRTIIENAALEPEIADLADALNGMGADISGAGTDTVTIDGVEKLGGFNHRVIPDRIETATFMIAAAITRGSIVLENTRPAHVGAVCEKLMKAGISVKSQGTKIICKWVKNLKPVSIRTGVYPGFPTDVQAQWMALMALTQGRSSIGEDVFENRFMHVSELQRLGADLKVRGNRVAVKGVESMTGAPIMVSDLRAGAALVLAGLAAKGRTEISRIYHLDRGYEHLEKKFKKLGANIKRIHC